MNQARAFRRRKTISDLTNEEIKNVLRDWLWKRKFKLIDDPQDNAYFQFIAEDPEGRPIIISRRHEHEHFIYVGSHCCPKTPRF